MLATKLRSATGGADPAWNLANAVYEGVPDNRFNFLAQDSSATDVFFKPDGLKMYVPGGSNDSVYEYNLAVAWDISTASYLQSFSVASEDTTPNGLFFKPDGTKMYVVGSNNDSVYEYNLSVAWNISTASYLQSFNIGSQETVPGGIFFKPDGLKVYIVGSTGDDVNEYDLGTAWDISTATYFQNFSVAAQETTPTGLFFKPDGLKMYIVGTSGDDVNEYDLSTAWNISTASFQQNFSVLAQVANPSGVFFKPDGDKMFISGGGGVFSYDFIVATGSIITQSAVLSSQDATMEDVFFKPDGLKMYAIGSSNDSVYEYDLSTAWDLSTRTYLQSFSVASQETVPTGLFFKPDGTKMYIVGSNGDEVNEYDLGTAWNISTASYLQNFSVSAEDSSPRGLSFKTDGTKMYVVGATGDDVNEYSLSTAWDISTAVYVQNFSVAAQETTPTGIFFDASGQFMSIIGTGNDTIYQYKLSNAWNISTASLFASQSVAAATTSPNGLFIGSGLIFVISSNSDLFCYQMAWNLGCANFVNPSTDYYSIAAQETNPLGNIFFKPDGLRMYVVGDFDNLWEYLLSSAWDISTASPSTSFSLGGQTVSPNSIFFKPDGTVMFTIDNLATASSRVLQYNLGLAWDLSTASYAGSKAVGSQDATPSGLFFKPDGTKMYITGTSGNSVYEYDVTTAWSVIGVVNYVQAFDVASQESTPTGLFFKPDGLKMYIAGSAGDDVNEYDLGTAWDISTASYLQNFSVLVYDSTLRGIFFKPDGLKMYISGASSDAVWAFDFV